jgi:hypothetical protein
MTDMVLPAVFIQHSVPKIPKTLVRPQPLTFILVSLVKEMTMRLNDNPGRDRPIILRCPQTVGELGRHAPASSKLAQLPELRARIIQGRAQGGTIQEAP